MDASTLTSGGLPWRASGAPDREALHLAVCWSLDEPDRAGEVAPIASTSILGRGGPQPSDGAPRVAFFRARPGRLDEQPALRGTRVSRTQLRLRPGDDGASLEIENVGQCPLEVGGRAVASARVPVGGCFALRNAYVFLVTRRPRAIEPLRSRRVADFPFGASDPHGMVGESPAAWALRDALAVVAAAGHHVLILGESGTGKELAARALHALSPRADGPFVSRSAATVPEGLIDAELFGCARDYPNKGSPEREGLVGAADGGTLFLDEIGELPAPLQAHLLRVLDAGGEHQRLGESRVRRSDLRLVAATNRPPDALKHDFGARFTVRLEVPPLGARREDVPLLVRHLLSRAVRSAPEVASRFVEPGGASAHARLDPLLVEALVEHPYALHLRELEQLLWIALTTSRGEFVELTEPTRARLRRDPDRSGAAEATPGEIDAALAAAGGNVTRAARALGLKNRYALYRLMKRHGLGGDARADAEGEEPAA